MTEYKKKVSGVTSILIRDAHGKGKINHSAWNNELQSERDFSDSSNNPKRRKKRNKINPFYGSVFRVVGALLIIYFWYGVFTGKYHEPYNLLKTFYQEKIVSHFESQPKQVIKEVPRSTYNASPKIVERPHKSNIQTQQKQVKMPVKFVEKIDLKNQEEVSPERIKYRLALISGETILADEYKVIGEIANYKYKGQNIFTNRNDVTFIQKVVLDVQK